MIWGLRKVVNMHNSQEWHLPLCPGVLQQALNRSSLLRNAAGKDYHPLADEDMEQNQRQNDTVAQDDPRKRVLGRKCCSPAS